MDLSSFEGDGEGEMSDEDMQKMMSQFTDLLGGDLGDLPLDLERLISCQRVLMMKVEKRVLRVKKRRRVFLQDLNKNQ